MTTRDRLPRIRASLERQRAELTSAGDVDVGRGDGSEAHEKVDDDAAPLAEMEQVIASSRNRQRAGQLAAINAALARLERDPEGFGVCEVCDEDIPTRRLELLPWVVRCTACQDSDGPVGPSKRRHLTDFR